MKAKGLYCASLRAVVIRFTRSLVLLSLFINVFNIFFTFVGPVSSVIILSSSYHCTRIQDDQFIVCLGGVNPLSFPSPPLPSLSSTFYPFVAKQLPLSLLHGPSQLRNLEERSSPLPCSESAERILGYILFNSKFPHLMRLITTHLAGEACWKNIRK